VWGEFPQGSDGLAICPENGRCPGDDLHQAHHGEFSRVKYGHESRLFHRRTSYPVKDDIRPEILHGLHEGRSVHVPGGLTCNDENGCVLRSAHLQDYRLGPAGTHLCRKKGHLSESAHVSRLTVPKTTISRYAV